ncbi:hypothetical protein [Helicobacter trogontum]|uniref:Uracil-DNA glycosylase-like domain-containing protein n=1 Tax=Helicobacter trogontum TaxID=50960 RepID=A0A4U8TK00_9HELI|nr:hypothetical protein [Helicobacter trogontum]MDY5184884.1 hypothetical protein [Helicobacter trogontum]TLD99097.1 hypothetical protein LS80_002490 [Helicobacter trogontum]
MQHNDEAKLYKYLKSLDMLYRHAMLGDNFIDLTKMTQNSDIQKQEKYPNPMQINQQYNRQTTNQPTDYNTQNNMQQITQKVMQCKLCSLSKSVKDSERLCAILPTNQAFNNVKETQTKSKIFPNIAFIIETLHLKESPKAGYAMLENLELNRSNEMLFDIIEKVFLLHKESVFLFPLFKCAEVGDNQQISMQIRTQALATQRRICSNYLHTQLENVDYAVFFGEHICFDFFEITLQEASGKLLDYHTMENKKVICVCVPDIMQMLINPKLKKDAFINFVLLKNAIYANSC